MLERKKLVCERKKLMLERKKLIVERKKLMLERKKLIVERKKSFVEEKTSLVAEKNLLWRRKVEHCNIKFSCSRANLTSFHGVRTKKLLRNRVRFDHFPWEVRVSCNRMRSTFHGDYMPTREIQVSNRYENSSNWVGNWIKSTDYWHVTPWKKERYPNDRGVTCQFRWGVVGK